MPWTAGKNNAFVSASTTDPNVVPVDYVENNINWRSWIFLDNGTFTVSVGGVIEYLIVGGGGGGGGASTGTRGGGGAGGQVIHGTMIVSPGSYSVSIGQGGSGGAAVTSTPPRTSVGGNGSSSSALGFTSVGGGGAFNTSVSQYNGGGANQECTGFDCTDAGISGSNRSGGSAGSHISTGSRAGGGGAGQMQNGIDSFRIDTLVFAGVGGLGFPSNISGQFKCYGNGGGGGIGTGVLGTGPFGAGDGGGSAGQSAISNHGDGGGGASAQNAGGNGGSGVVIIRYRLPNFPSSKLELKMADFPSIYYDASISEGYSLSDNIFYDLSGNGNNGSIVNSATFSSTDGGSLSFNGSNQYINSPLRVGFAGESFTFGGYARVNASTTSNFFIFSNFTEVSQTPFYAIVFNSSGSTSQLLFRNTSSQNTTISFTGGLSLNTWYYLVGVRDAENNTISFYLNGSLVNSATFAGSQNISGNNNFGAIRHLSNYLNANIGLMHMYPRALNASEISNNFNSTRARFGI